MVRSPVIALLLGGLMLVGTAGTARGVLVQWTAASGGNDHWYDIVFDDFTDSHWWTWNEANALAGAMTYNDGGTLLQGHLVTYATEDEMNFVNANVGLQNNSIYSHHYWLGGYQTPTGKPENTPGNMPDDNWNWVTGETWEFVNWWGVAPNDQGGVEDYLAMSATVFDVGRWNDMGDAANPGPNRATAYIVEYEAAAAVPEPATILLFGTGIAGIAGIRLRRKKGARTL